MQIIQVIVRAETGGKIFPEFPDRVNTYINNQSQPYIKNNRFMNNRLFFIQQDSCRD